jgi:ubiquinol-cytochrome c reductase cytochrome c subunit
VRIARRLAAITGRPGLRRVRLLGLVGTGTAALFAAVALAQPQSGIVRPAQEPATASPKLGEQLFNANCASCHGIGGTGIASARPGAGDVSGAGPSLRGVGAQAADFYLRTGAMPLPDIHAQPENRRVLLSKKEIASLTEFVASLGSGPPIPHPDPGSGSIAQGFALFNEDCAGCHQSVARGGFVTGARVPPLQGIGPTEIAEAVRIGPYLMPRFSRTRISDAELNSIVRYVLHTNRPVNRGGWSIGNLGPIPEGLVAWLAALLLGASCVILGKKLRS